MVVIWNALCIIYSTVTLLVWNQLSIDNFYHWIINFIISYNHSITITELFLISGIEYNINIDLYSGVFSNFSGP